MSLQNMILQRSVELILNRSLVKNRLERKKGRFVLRERRDDLF